jgi:hypothetical protein
MFNSLAVGAVKECRLFVRSVRHQRVGQLVEVGFVFEKDN